jgi:hypothetical protein
MLKQQKKLKYISDCFTPALTDLFKVEVDIALKKLDLQSVESVLANYQIAHFQDSIDFLEALGPILQGWKREGRGSVVVGSVTTSKSRCIACEIGRNMTVYEFEYKHANAPAPMNRVHYSWNFGILMDIRNGILFEMRVCNGFLNKEELQAIR